MAESFTNSLTRFLIGIVTTSSSGSIRLGVTIITGISTDGIGIGDMVQDVFTLEVGPEVAILMGQVRLDKTSTNVTSVSSQSVSFLGVTTAPIASKSILVGGTFCNLTDILSNFLLRLER